MNKETTPPQPVIEVSNLSKTYTISHQQKAQYGSLRDNLTTFLEKPFLRKNQTASTDESQEQFWALKDVSFTVNKGEIFGVMGQNGSGKSTLLKILSRIVDPTSGEVVMRGKVASLLEVGTGFHPELTGRENVFFNGSMLGMSRDEVGQKFDEIVKFSEIEKFLDTPVKFYSSGMYVRLAFAVAAHLDPEILIIDEVLAVGDAQFQKKCMNKILSIAKKGKTILFVSHSTTTVESLCNRALLLEKGHVKFIGETEFAADKYINREIPEVTVTEFEENPKKEAQFLEMQILNAAGEKATSVGMGEDWSLDLTYKISEPAENTIIGVEILTHDGNAVYMTADGDFQKEIPTQEPGTYHAVITFNKFHFNPGVFYIRASIQSPGKVVHDVRENYPLRIRKKASDIRTKYFGGKYMGFVNDKIEWQIDKKG
ncbi:MAG TPA: ABC transporter ATP-binding protein [Candidatus Saccharimonadales bacterium]|nr:ABC transporter ATP-binding protein [Candidatus Saccharimonadales bacterium]